MMKSLLKKMLKNDIFSDCFFPIAGLHYPLLGLYCADFPKNQIYVNGLFPSDEHWLKIEDFKEDDRVEIIYAQKMLYLDSDEWAIWTSESIHVLKEAFSMRKFLNPLPIEEWTLADIRAFCNTFHNTFTEFISEKESLSIKQRILGDVKVESHPVGK